MKKIAAVLVTIVILFVTTSVRAESTGLKTQTGKDIGLSLSTYQYQEPGIMSLQGMKMGLDLHAVKVLEERGKLILRGDLRFAFGSVDYTSTGTGSASGNPDWYIEARGLVGKDWAIKDAVISPYAGLGYRYLFHDGRGITSAGYGGYRRESNYFYFPLGVIHRRALNDQARLESTLEYDTLLFGKQISSLSDVGGGYSDATNNQSSGYGLRLSVLYQESNWSIGPYVYYWNIGQSDIVPAIRNGSQVYKNGIPMGWIEPNNNTVEFGLKASQQF